MDCKYISTRSAEQLIKNGWRCIGTKRDAYGLMKLWDHPDHQPDKHGAFTTVDAFLHQRQSLKEGCDCINNSNAR